VIDPDTSLPVFNEDGTPKLEKVGGKHMFAGP
jgi:hypothetical protein